MKLSLVIIGGGARTLNSSTAFYYGYTVDSPGMIMSEIELVK